MNTIVQFIVIFGVILMMFMFGLIFIKEGGDQFIIDPLEDIAIQVANNSGAPDETVQTLGVLQTAYDKLTMPYDLLFFAFWMMAIGTTFVASFKARKLPITSFFGILFVGSLLLLLIISFVAQFTDWFILNFYDLLFSDLGIDTPIMAYFFSNMSWIVYLWIMVCVFINRIDVSEGFSVERVEP